MMKHDFMTEIENLIASMSITEISEFLGVPLNMEVPQIRIMKGEENQQPRSKLTRYE